jgi:hypothetical protein
MKRIVNERGDLVEMELPPDVFAAVAWWHQPPSWYGPVTQEQRRPAARARDPDPDAVCLDRLAHEPVEHEIVNIRANEEADLLDDSVPGRLHRGTGR